MNELAEFRKQYPWYDSRWLAAYVYAKRIIQQHCPHRLEGFIAGLEPLKTSADFQVKSFNHVIDNDTLHKAREIIRGLESSKMCKKEILNFGRFRLHNHPFFTRLQHVLTDLVCEAAGEEVEPCYNFLSVYGKHGLCQIHMDAPEAKWTLDVCIEQSVPWPIYFSQVQDWPEDFPYQGADWAQQIKDDPSNIFTPYICQPSDGILFSGSSQWHYRNIIPKDDTGHYSHLVFFHFIPRGFRDLIKPGRWELLFGIPELEPISRYFNSQQHSLSLTGLAR